MPIMRMKEINDMSSADRSKRLDELRTELARLKTMIHAGGTVENPARVKALRRTIARILTVETEQRRGVKKEEEKPEKKPKARVEKKPRKPQKSEDNKE